MARHLRTQKQIDAFIAQVIQQATHHASQVAQIIQPLANGSIGALRLFPAGSVRTERQTWRERVG
ncbi:hypothetical protein [Burkholderia multivorans]|uniref:hypothetical protein n=1 Tax=Burkholderia multivorans TaxID=87883 RepID=UPI00112201F3|nr:hypothetical protein [Burkholderia multivorans]